MAVKFSLKIKDDLKKLTSDPQFLDHLGSQVIIEMKKQIAVGLSPVNGEGRFVAYSAQRNSILTKQINRRIKNLDRLIKHNEKVKGPILNSQQSSKLASIQQGYEGLKRYPLNVLKQFPDKQVRPVNLELSGDMLDSLTFKKTAGGITVGIFDGTQAEKAKGHQSGDPEKALPKRRFLPAAKGEKFNTTLTRLIWDLYSDALGAILKKK